MIKHCLICLKDISYKNSKYCSLSCFHEHRKGMPLFKRRRREEKSCRICNNIFEVGGRAGPKNKLYCSIRCLGISRRKPIEFAFNGRRLGANWEELRENILERDNHTCMFCGNNINLQIHHIIPRIFGGKHDKKNLISCCRHCHGVIDRIIKIAKNNNPSFNIEKFTIEVLGKNKEINIIDR